MSASPPEELLRYRDDDPSIKLIAHPECPPEVVEICDFSGSTAAMIDYVRTRQPSRVLLVTECSMADNVAAETPGVEFVRPCNLCPHMKRITLPKILDSLVYMREEVMIDPALAARARALGRAHDRIEVRDRSVSRRASRKSGVLADALCGRGRPSHGGT